MESLIERTQMLSNFLDQSIFNFFVRLENVFLPIPNGCWRGNQNDVL